jgi:hypothetical protein
VGGRKTHSGGGGEEGGLEPAAVLVRALEHHIRNGVLEVSERNEKTGNGGILNKRILNGCGRGEGMSQTDVE